VDWGSQLKRVVDLESLPGGAKENGGRSQLAYPVDRHHELGAIGGHDDDPLARYDAFRAEVSSKRVAAAFNFEKRPTVVAGSNEVSLPELRRGSFEPAVHGYTHHWQYSSLF
jgi:hypothetical protein